MDLKLIHLLESLLEEQEKTEKIELEEGYTKLKNLAWKRL